MFNDATLMKNITSIIKNLQLYLISKSDLGVLKMLISFNCVTYGDKSLFFCFQFIRCGDCDFTSTLNYDK